MLAGWSWFSWGNGRCIDMDSEMGRIVDYHSHPCLAPANTSCWSLLGGLLHFLGHYLYDLGHLRNFCGDIDADHWICWCTGQHFQVHDWQRRKIQQLKRRVVWRSESYPSNRWKRRYRPCWCQVQCIDGLPCYTAFNLQICIVLPCDCNLVRSQKLLEVIKVIKTC